MDRLTEFKEIMMETMSPVASEMLCDICIHYSNAIAKHPWFSDDICSSTCDWYKLAKVQKMYLRDQETAHAMGRQTFCCANEVLEAELAEIYEAYLSGKLEQARDEIYDAIAVLLRMDDMIAKKQMEAEP